MGKIISISNQKGGVGKTTTAVNLAASLAAAEKRTLLIDIDPQGNACSGVGVEKDQLKNTIYNVIIGEIDIFDAVKKTDLAYLDLVPSNSHLTGAELELVSASSRERKLKTALDKVLPDYDYIIIDSPPSLGLLTVNALTAAASVIVPLQCEFYAMEGLAKIIKTIELIKESLNPDIYIEGILLTMFDRRNNLSFQVAKEVRSHFNGQVFDSVIPRNVRLSESPSHGKPVLLYDIASKGATSYLDLAKEIMGRSH